MLFALPKRKRAHHIAHPVLTDHLAGNIGRPLDVVRGALGKLVQDNFLSRAAAHQAHDFVEQVNFAPVVLLLGQVPRGPEGEAPGDNRHLVNGVGVRQDVRHQGMARLVVSRISLLLLADDHAAALPAHEHLVLGLFEVAHIDDLLILSGSPQCRFVDHVGQLSAGEARRAAGESFDIYIGPTGDVLDVDGQNPLAALYVGQRDNHLAVEPAGAQQGRVEDIRPVRGGDQDHPVVGFKPIHLDQKLIEGLLPLVVPTTEARAPMATDRVNLVDENDARGLLLALLKEVPHPGGPYTDEHLHEIASRDGEEGDVGLAGDGPGQQGLAGPGRSHQKDPLGNLPTQTLKLLRIGQEIDDFLQLLLGLIDPGNVFEGRLLLRIRQQAGLALAKREGLRSPGLHLAHKENPYAQEQHHREPSHKQVHVPRGLLRRLDADPNPLGAQKPDQLRVLWREGPKLLAPDQATVNAVAQDENLFDLTLLDHVHKVAEDDSPGVLLRPVKDLEEGNHNEPDD